MGENNGSAGILYKRYLEEQKKQSDEFKKSFAKISLKLPVPMSYELWCYLHSIVGDV